MTVPLFEWQVWKGNTMATLFDEEGYVSAPLLTIGDAAKYLGVGRKVLYQLIERGEIIAVKSKRTWLIEKKGLDEFRAKGTLT
jgi:excisionase family DNA binding protein